MPAALHAVRGCGGGHDRLDSDARQQNVDFYNFFYAVLWAHLTCTAAFARPQASCYAFAASACALCSKLEMSFSLRSSVRTSRLHLTNRRVSGETQRKMGAAGSVLTLGIWCPASAPQPTLFDERENGNEGKCCRGFETLLHVSWLERRRPYVVSLLVMW